MTFDDEYAKTLMNNELDKIQSYINDVSTSTNLSSLLTSTVQYYTSDLHAKLLKEKIESGYIPLQKEFENKRPIHIKKFCYPIVHKKEHSFKKFSGNVLYFFYIMKYDFFAVQSNIVEFRQESPMLEFDNVILKYANVDSVIHGDLYYCLIPSGQTQQKFFQKMKKDSLCGLENDFTLWCKFSFSIKDILYDNLQYSFVQAFNFTNKLDKYFQEWNLIALSIMVPCNNPNISTFSSVALVSDRNDMCYKKIRIRHNGLTASNKDSFGDLCVETPIIKINQNTKFEIFNTDPTTSIKFYNTDEQITLSFHNKDDAILLTNIVQNYLDDQQIFGNKLVLTTCCEFDYKRVLKMANSDATTFFDNINAYIF